MADFIFPPNTFPPLLATTFLYWGKGGGLVVISYNSEIFHILNNVFYIVHLYAIPGLRNILTNTICLQQLTSSLQHHFGPIQKNLSYQEQELYCRNHSLLCNALQILVLFQILKLGILHYNTVQLTCFQRPTQNFTCVIGPCQNIR